MKSVPFLLVLILILSYQVSQAQPNQKIVSQIWVDSVWAGHRVRFALCTDSDRQYIAYYNADRHIVVGQRTLGENSFETYRLPPKERNGREGTSTILGWDSHNSLTLAVDAAGYIHLSGNMHANGLTYFRTSKPNDITTIVQVESMVGDKENKCTYPVFMKNKEGVLFFRYRDGGSGNGSNIYNQYDVPTQRWSRLHDPLVDGEGKMNAYTSKPRKGPDGWFHLFWVWRDTPDCSTNHDLSYMKSPDLVNWYTMTGEKIELPIRYTTPGLVVDPVPAQGGMINGGVAMEFDIKGNPVFLYHKYDRDGNLELYTSSWEENAWQSKVLTDWNYRWEFSGYGSINSEVKIYSFQKQSNGKYHLNYYHIQHGEQTALVNSDFKIERILKDLPARYDHFTLESSFPGMMIQSFSEQSQQYGGIAYMLKWESLGSNRDKPRPKPWPRPSNLYLYELAPN